MLRRFFSTSRRYRPNTGGLGRQIRSRLRGETLEFRRMLATFSVTNLNDSGPGSLRDAVNQVNASADSTNFVEFDSGLTGAINLTSGELAITNNVDILGNGSVVIDAAGGASRIFNVDDGDANTVIGVEIDNLTLTGGVVLTRGGAINNAEVLTLRNVIVTDSSAQLGGGIHNEASGNLRLLASHVDGNTTTFNGGGISNFGTLELEDSEVSGNHAISGSGGGISSSNGATTFVNSTVADNRAGYYGGGVHVIGGTITSVDSTISGNSCLESGGGLYVAHTDEGGVQLSGTTLDGNTAFDDGGGISGVYAEVETNNSTISGNEAKTGGGIAGLFAEFELFDSLLELNVAGGLNPSYSEGTGGALAFFNTLAQLNNVLLKDNTATVGGAAFQVAYDSVLQMSNSTVTGNQAPKGAGGAVDQPSGARMDGRSGNPRLIIEDSDFINNVATDDDGGGLFIEPNNVVTITGSTFMGNSAFDDGGGLFVEENSVVNISDSSVRDNSAADLGGGMRTAPGTTVTMSNVTVDGNYVADIGGGGMTIAGSLDCTNCAITGNTSHSTGGGIDFLNGAVGAIRDSLLQGNVTKLGFFSRGGAIGTGNDVTLEIDRTTIAANESGRGGALASFSGTVYEITNSTISGNTGVRAGGGVFWDGSDGVMRNTTIAHNESPQGGGVYIRDFNGAGTFQSVTIASNSATDQGGGFATNDTFGYASTFTFQNSIIADNVATNGGNDVFNPNAFDLYVDFSLVEDPAGITIAGANNLLAVDPQLTALADNGGPTQTMALGDGSPARNAGDPAAAAGQGTTPEFDQRGAGFARVFEGRIDMGAFESQPTSVVDCDFDDDGDCDIDDIDALITEIAGGMNDSAFDLTGNNTVDLADRDQWLADAGALNLPSGNAFLLGDSNLDGTVDGQDFLDWNANKFTSTGTWSQADWNADGTTDGQDFLVWNSSKFQSSDRSPRIDRFFAGLVENSDDDEESPNQRIDMIRPILSRG